MKKKDSYSPLLRLTGIASQMVGALVLAILIGNQIDEYFANQRPIATLVALLVGLMASFWLIYKDLKKIL